MGQYFLIANDEKQQYLNPFSFPSSERFPSILKNSLVSDLILWLTANSDHKNWVALKEKSLYSSIYMGSWSGDTYRIYGDYQHELHSKEIHSTYNDISLHAIAMLFEIYTPSAEGILEDAINGEKYNLGFLSKIATLDSPPKAIIDFYKSKYGENWKSNIYKYFGK